MLGRLLVAERFFHQPGLSLQRGVHDIFRVVVCGVCGWQVQGLWRQRRLHRLSSEQRDEYNGQYAADCV
jgi:hypothetical protein